jgi:hypothetical protein
MIMWNPVRAIINSNSLRGVKIIALSLMLVLLCAAPIMLYSLLGPDDGGPIVLGWLFAAGAIIAHLGFLIGILLIIWDLYFTKK